MSVSGIIQLFKRTELRSLINYGIIYATDPDPALKKKDLIGYGTVRILGLKI